jgi:hypothetical protein
MDHAAAAKGAHIGEVLEYDGRRAMRGRRKRGKTGGNLQVRVDGFRGGKHGRELGIVGHETFLMSGG